MTNAAKMREQPLNKEEIDMTETTMSAFETAMENLYNAVEKGVCREELTSLFHTTLLSTTTVDEVFEVWEIDEFSIEEALLPINEFSAEEALLPINVIFNHAMGLIKNEEDFFKLLSFQDRHGKFIKEIPIFEKYLESLKNEDDVLRLLRFVLDDYPWLKDTVENFFYMEKMLGIIFKRLHELHKNEE